MPQSETALQMAERHVGEFEVKVASQETIVRRLTDLGHEQAVIAAERLLTTYRETLALARCHVAIEAQRRPPLAYTENPPETASEKASKTGPIGSAPGAYKNQ